MNEWDRHTMPRILKNPPTNLVVRLRIKQPPPKPLIMTLRPPQYRISRNSELRTAAHAYCVWDFKVCCVVVASGSVAVEEIDVCFSVDLLGLVADGWRFG